MDLKKHLEKSREKLKNPRNAVNQQILDYFADIHSALTWISIEIGSIQEQHRS